MSIETSEPPAKAENYGEVLELFEEEMLSKMQSMRKRAEYADNALTAMEVRRKDKIAEKMLKIELEMKQHLEISNRKCRKFYEQHKKMRQEIEAEFQNEIERQELDYRRRQTERIKQEQAENRHTKEKRAQQLELKLQELEEKQLPNESESSINCANLIKKTDSKQIISSSSHNNPSKEQQQPTAINDEKGKVIDSISDSNAESGSSERNGNEKLKDKNVVVLKNPLDDDDSFEENRYYYYQNKMLSKISPVSDTVVTFHEQRNDNDNLLSLQTFLTKRYFKIITFKTKWMEKISKMDAIKNQVEIKYSLQKMVNTPINAIAATSSEHMKHKLSKLRELLTGTNSIQNTPQLQLSIEYSTNLLAAKFVKQGEVLLCMKSVLDEGFQGFSYAAIVTALWADHPDFGQLYLAYTYDTCPYLIPQIPPDMPENPTKQHYEDRGYKYEEDGTVEKQDKFVNRMSGVARLLACVAVSPLPNGEQGKEHPFGLGNIWKWLCSTLNLSPVNDVTATLLHDVLEITASRMIEQYNKHFLEIVRLLNDVYLNKIKAVTIEGSGGPIVRLEQFLKRIINNPSAIKAPSASKLKSGLNYL